MEFKESQDIVLWMLQHIGATLWSIGADGKVYGWKLSQVIAQNGAFPFNVLFICSTPNNKHSVVFTVGDVGKCLFTSTQKLYGKMSQQEEAVAAW